MLTVVLIINSQIQTGNLNWFSNFSTTPKNQSKVRQLISFQEKEISNTIIESFIKNWKKYKFSNSTEHFSENEIYVCELYLCLNKLK